MIIEDLKAELKQAMLARNAERVSVLRFLMAGITNKEIELRTQGVEFADKHIVKVLEKQIKQRNDSIESYRQGKREDLVAKEQSELSILEELLKKYAPSDVQ